MTRAERAERPWWAERLRQGMRAAGFETYEALRQALGIKGTSQVYKYCAGDDQPSLKMWQRISEVTGLPVAFYLDPDYNDRLNRAATGMIVGWLHRLMEGDSLELAIDEGTADRQYLGPEERDFLRGREGSLRRHIAAAAPRPWAKLSPRERQDLLAALVALPGEEREQERSDAGVEP